MAEGRGKLPFSFFSSLVGIACVFCLEMWELGGSHLPHRAGQLWLEPQLCVKLVQRGWGSWGSVPACWPRCLARGLPARKVLRFFTIHGRNRLIWPADASEQRTAKKKRKIAHDYPGAVLRGKQVWWGCLIRHFWMYLGIQITSFEEGQMVFQLLFWEAHVTGCIIHFTWNFRVRHKCCYPLQKKSFRKGSGKLN